MAYGTASGPDDIERYYTDIRGGAAPSPEHLAELKERYAAIGNVFPLLDTTRRRPRARRSRLNRATATSFRPYLGMKHSPPFIPEAVARMRDDGVERAVGIVMAPHWSGMSVETYVERVERAVEERAAAPSSRSSAATTRTPRSSRSSRVGSRRRSTDPDDERAGAIVLFTAHSLPTRVVEDGSLRCYLRLRRVVPLPRRAPGDGGPRGRARSASDHGIAWQSAGRTADPWWGPPGRGVDPRGGRDGASGGRRVLGRVRRRPPRDLYDLDIEAKAVAEGAGVRFARTRMPNADPAFLDVLADVVRDHLAETGGGVTGRVAIVGGGVAGLATAYRLLRAGARSDRVRARGRRGRRSRRRSTGRRPRPRAGPDSLVARKPWGVDLCREPRAAARPARRRRARSCGPTRASILPAGTAFGIPGDVGDVLRWPGLSRGGRFRALGDLVKRGRGERRRGDPRRAPPAPASATRPPTSRSRRSWPGSTPATSTGCRRRRRSPSWSRGRRRRGA